MLSLLLFQCIEEWLWTKQTCPTCRKHVAMPEPLYWTSTRVKVPWPFTATYEVIFYPSEIAGMKKERTVDMCFQMNWEFVPLWLLSHTSCRTAVGLSCLINLGKHGSAVLDPQARVWNFLLPAAASNEIILDCSSLELWMWTADQRY